MSLKKIDGIIGKQIFEAMFKILQQAGISRVGYIGVIHSEGSEPSDVYCLVTPLVSMFTPIQETLAELRDGKRGICGDRFITNTYLMAGVKVGKLIVVCYSQASREANEAVAVVYGHYHDLVETRGPIVDDIFSDILLCHIGQWQESNRQKNDFILPLAQTVFKPELVK